MEKVKETPTGLTPIFNADKILFRCSSLGYIMTEARKSETLSETCKAHLVDVYIWNVYNREKEIESKYIKKGLQVEEKAITLYSQYKDQCFYKNEKWFTDEFISGTPDIVTKYNVPDVKASWDIFTFFKARTKPLNKIYYWQMQGYMSLTRLDEAIVVHCLVDTPQPLLEQEMIRLKYKMGIENNAMDDPMFVEACREIERSGTFKDIRPRNRIHEFKVERNDEDIDRIHKRVLECREWLNENFFDKE